MLLTTGFLQMGPEANAFLEGNHVVVLNVKPRDASRGAKQPIKRVRKATKQVHAIEEQEVTEIETTVQVTKSSKSVHRSTSMTKGTTISFDDDEEQVDEVLDTDEEIEEINVAGPSKPRSNVDDDPIDENEDSPQDIFNQLKAEKDEVRSLTLTPALQNCLLIDLQLRRENPELPDVSNDFLWELALCPPPGMLDSVVLFLGPLIR